jgi:hypothetical protein
MQHNGKGDTLVQCCAARRMTSNGRCLPKPPPPPKKKKKTSLAAELDGLPAIIRLAVRVDQALQVDRIRTRGFEGQELALHCHTVGQARVLESSWQTVMYEGN